MNNAFSFSISSNNIKQWHVAQSNWTDDRLYSAILRSLEQTHSARMWCYMSD